MFFTPERYDLSNVGRMKFNRRLGREEIVGEGETVAGEEGATTASEGEEKIDEKDKKTIETKDKKTIETKDNKSVDKKTVDKKKDPTKK